MEYIDQKKNTDVYEFIKRNPCSVLATQHESEGVDMAHVYVFVDLVLNGFFVSKIDTRKYDNIEANPDVSLFFSDRDALQQVEYKGRAEALTDSKEIMEYFPKLQELLAAQKAEYWTPPVSQIPGEGYVVIKVSPSSIVYRDYSREDKDAGPHEYEVKM